MEEKAARAYDLAALKYWGPSTHINFPVHDQILYLVCLTILRNFCELAELYMSCCFCSWRTTSKNLRK